MIEIRVFRGHDWYSLALPPNVMMQRDTDTTFLSREMDAKDFTWPIELPLNDENLINLGFVNVIANPLITPEYRAELIVDAIFVSQGLLKVLSVDIAAATVSVSFIGAYGSVGKQIGTKKVTELELGGIRTIGAPDPANAVTVDMGGNSNFFVNYTPCDSHIYMADLAAGTVTDDFLFPMAIDEKADVPGMEGSRNLINWWRHEPIGGSFYIDPVLHNIVFTFEQNVSSEKAYWVPYFRLLFVLKKCFTDCGITVVNDALSGTPFEKILLANTYAINSCTVSESIDGGNNCVVEVEHMGYTIDPRNHVPKIKVTEFITEAAKMYNLQYIFDPRRQTVEIRMLNSLSPDASQLADLTDVALQNPVINFEQQDYNRGFSFNFELDPADSALTTNEELNTITIYGTVDSVVTLFFPPYSNMAPVGSVVFIKPANAYYKKIQAGNIWALFSHNALSYQTSTSDNLVNISTKFNPMPMKWFQFNMDPGNGSVLTSILAWGGGTWHEESLSDPILPYSSMGMEGKDLIKLFVPNNGDYSPTDGNIYLGFVQVQDMKPIEYYPKVINWHGFRYVDDSPGTNDPYPFASDNIYEHHLYGTAMTGFTLSWKHPLNTDLYNECGWKVMVETLRNSIGVDWKVLLDAAKYAGIDLNQQFITINDLNYICTKAEVVMPFPAIANLKLIRI